MRKRPLLVIEFGSVLPLPGGGQRRGTGGVIAAELQIVAQPGVGGVGVGEEARGGGVHPLVVADHGKIQAFLCREPEPLPESARRCLRSLFGPAWEALPSGEQARILRLLVERVEHDWTYEGRLLRDIYEETYGESE